MLALPKSRQELENATVTSPEGGRSYTLIRQVGAGSFGHVFKATDHSRSDQCAVKVEPTSLAIKPLKHEARVYRKLAGCKGIPQMRDYFQTVTDTILVMDLLGPSLGTLFEYNCKGFSLKTVAQIAIEMLKVLEDMHAKGYVHRDIKPGNILFDEKTSSELAVIDLGMAKSFLDEHLEHKPMDEGKGLNGTARYASINAHQGRGQSRRDDLESLGYVLVYLAIGSVPWQGLKNSENKNDDIAKMKIDTPLEDFCSGYPAADAVRNHILYARNLGYYDRPDYDYIRGLYIDNLAQYEIQMDGVWDWNQKDEDAISAGDKTQYRPKTAKKSGDEASGSSNPFDEGNESENKPKKEKGNACSCVIS